jgi:hypothetical protein
VLELPLFLFLFPSSSDAAEVRPYLRNTARVQPKLGDLILALKITPNMLEFLRMTACEYFKSC